jgi:hypothetical protein
MALPKDYLYAIRCSTPESIYHALRENLDLRMLSLTTCEIWDHMEAVRNFIDAGGVLTMADLSYAIKNEAVDFEELLQLIDPKTIFNCESDDDLEKLCKKGTQNKWEEIIFINSTTKLIGAILCSKRSNKLEILDIILDNFDLPKSFFWRTVTDACLCPHNHKIAHNIIEKLVSKQILSSSTIVHYLIRSHGETMGIFIKDHNQFNIDNKPFDDQTLLAVLKILDLDPTEDRIARDCIYLNSMAAMKYLHENGFDVVKNAFNTRYNGGYRLLQNIKIEVFDYLLSIGVDFKSNIDFFLRTTFHCYVEEKLGWFIKKIAKDDMELMTKIKCHANDKQIDAKYLKDLIYGSQNE